MTGLQDCSCRIRLALRQPEHEGAGFGNEPVGVHRKPEQLGQLTDDDGQCQPVHIADLGRLGQLVRHETELGQLVMTITTPTSTASSDASMMARAGSLRASRSGAIVAAIIGPRAESGPQHQYRDGPKTA